MQHLDEGTIHAWLDGALSPEEAAKVEAHASECAQCAALVAEARGLIAASTRILNALDDVPSGVIPSVPADVASVPQIVKRRHWYDRTDFRAAAAILFVAGASLVIVKSQRSPTASLKTAAVVDRAAPFAVHPESNAVMPPVAADKIERMKASEPAERDAFVAPAPPAARPEATERRAVTPPSIVGGLKARSRDEGLREDRFAPPPANAAPSPMVAQPAPPPPATMEKAIQGNVAGARVGAAMMDVATNRAVQGRVTGRITTSRGIGLGSANVMVQGTNLAANTDTSGKFKIDNVPAGEHRLIVRRIGYNQKTVPISVNDSVTTANAALDASASALSEVVVTGVAATGAPTLRQLRADTTGTTHRTVFEVSPGIEVTLVEIPVVTEMESGIALDQRAKAEAKKDSAVVSTATKRADDKILAAPAPPMAMARPNNTITWTQGNRRYTLTGPLSTRQLDEIKTQLMRIRR